MRKPIFLLLLFWLMIGCQNTLPVGRTPMPSFFRLSAEAPYQETFRPQYHFTPRSSWMNDPNGMVYYQGEYHLFYQYHPYSSSWGPMHWGQSGNWNSYEVRSTKSLVLPQGGAYEIMAEFETESEVQFRFENETGEAVAIVYSQPQQELCIDRSQAGQVGFSQNFPGIHAAPLTSASSTQLHIFMDWSSIEVFANGGEAVLTDLIFPHKGLNVLKISGDPVQIKQLDIWPLRSSW